MSCRFMIFFFFQAEDGIRDLVRSRGLGDVYKRQDRTQRPDGAGTVDLRGLFDIAGNRLESPSADQEPVSYTHLTLPTSDLV